MAYDPEARENSNSAMIIAIVAVVLVVLGALAWYATRPDDVGPDTVVTTPPTTVVEKETVTEVPVPSDAPDTIVVQPGAPAPAPAPSTSTTTNVEIRPPATSGTTTDPAPAGDGASSATTNNITVTPPAGDAATEAGNSATGGATTSPGY